MPVRSRSPDSKAKSVMEANEDRWYKGTLAAINPHRTLNGMGYCLGKSGQLSFRRVSMMVWIFQLPFIFTRVKALTPQWFFLS